MNEFIHRKMSYFRKLLSGALRLAVSVEDAAARAGATPAPYLLTGNCVKLW